MAFESHSFTTSGFKCIKEAWFLIFSDISLMYLPFHYSRRLNRDQCSLFHILLYYSKRIDHQPLQIFKLLNRRRCMYNCAILKHIMGIAQKLTKAENIQLSYDRTLVGIFWQLDFFGLSFHNFLLKFKNHTYLPIIYFNRIFP